MAKSRSKTTIAALRSIIGISAKEFAELIGRSIDAVKSLESGRLALSEDLAKKINVETNVDVRWLLDGDPQMPPLLDIAAREYLSTRRKKHRKDYEDASYSKEDFDRVRAARLAKESPPEGEHTREEQIICILFRLLFLYSSARENGEEVMACYRFDKIEGDIAEEFGLSLDEPTFELASRAGRCLQELADRLKRDQKDLSDLAFAPSKVDPDSDKRRVKFLQFRHRTAKALRAINESRKGSRTKRDSRSVPAKEGLSVTYSDQLTEAEIRALFEPVRKRMEAKGYTEAEIRARWEKFRTRNGPGGTNLSAAREETPRRDR